MSLFEFIMVLLSMIIGLGVAEVLTGVSHALLRRRLTLDSWHLLLLCFLVFVSLTQVWWESWTLHDVAQWNFVQLLLLLINPVLLYTLSHLLFPEIDSATSLRAHYFENHRLLYIVVSLTALSALLFQPLAFGAPLVAIHNLNSILVFGGSLALAASRKPALHSSILPIGALLAAFDIAAGVFSIS